MQARNEIALDDEIVLLGAADRDVGAALIHENLLPLIPQAKAVGFVCPLALA